MKTFHCLTKHQAMKMYGGSGGIALCILTSALDRVEWSASRPGSFTPGGTAAGIHWIGGWVGYSDGLDTVAKRIYSFPVPAGN
jgi:hypothetical protein